MDSNLNGLRALTLNCWGLKFVASKRKERILAIANWIADSSNASHNSEGEEIKSYDVIALQEIWIKSDFDLIALKAKEVGLVYSKFFHSGAIGSGLAFLSSHPILSSFIQPYSLNGYPLNVIQGDFYAAKSISGITIKIQIEGKGLVEVEVLNTHLYAPGGECENWDGAHRVAQCWELGKVVREKVKRGRFVILMGDLNSQPHSLPIRLIHSLTSLQDSFLLTNPPPPSLDSPAHLSLTALERLNKHGITCDSDLNSYGAPKLLKRAEGDETRRRGGKRLDYILFRGPQALTQSQSTENEPSKQLTLTLVPISTKVVLTSLIPSTNYSYSDHFGFEALFSFQFLPSSSPSSSSTVSTEDLSLSINLLNESLQHCLSSSQTQLLIALISVLLIPVLAISASFQPLNYLNWIFVLLGVLVGAGGSTFFYTGWVGGRWEEGSLRNLIGELEAERERRGGD